jgi:cytoskeletal protein CcmA (bactofilin family)
MSFFGNRRQAEPQPTPAPAPQKPQVVTPQQPVGFETVLGTNSTLEGHLRSSANVRLDGTFTGTLEIGGNVLVGETAQINADINARNISIAGAVRGNVHGKKVQLLRTGRIWGDIRATALTTEEGAFIDGKITMISQQEETPDPTDAPDAAAGLGAVEDETLNETDGASNEPVQNISEGEEDELPVGGDWNEGQTNADYKDLPDNETRQST